MPRIEKKPPEGCTECRDLQSHDFRTIDDLVHAVQVAAAEVDRGVLRRIAAPRLTMHEQEALDAALATSLPQGIRYFFECTQCGDRFELIGDTGTGMGHWARQPARSTG